MAKIRIYELAKELGLENKRILEMCSELGIEGKKSHSSSLSDDEAENLRRMVIRSALSGGNLEREVVKEGEVLTERRMAKGGVIRRRKKQEEPVAVEAPEPIVEEVENVPADLIEEVQEEATKTQEEVEEVEVPEPVVENVEEVVLETSEESTDGSQEEQLSELREKHDIRAPKVLGKIELPTEQKVQPKTSTQEDEGVFSKKKKGKSHGKDKDDYNSKKSRKKRQVLQKVDLLDYDTDRATWKPRKDKKTKKSKDESSEAASPVKVGKRIVKVDSEISVGEFSRQLGEKVGDVIGKLMSLGTMATINQLIDFDTAVLIAEEFGAECTNVGTDVEEEIATLVKASTGEHEDEFIKRPPIVTVMGHVDHGKTSLLDAIRSASVTKGEFGGITQHIGAYIVDTPAGKITFLDTPGHEAFTAMRSRGAQVTDVVILVVAADDGVMPQTLEAINHAKAAGVPIVVAINKIDKEDANLERIKNQLSERELVPEDWGGDTMMIPVSAITREGIDNLLESVLLQSEVLELKANPSARAVATVIESKLDRGRGPVMTVLVQSGTLKKGDIFIAGAIQGKVRALIDDQGNQIDEAGPSTPVEILGASSAPMSGDDFLVLDSDAQAKKYAENRQQKERQRELSSRSGAQNQSGGLTLESLSSMIDAGELKELPIVVKADVQGSVEAVAQSLERVANEEVTIKVIHKGVGAVTENDVQLASASKGIIVAFNVRADSRAAPAASEQAVEIFYSRVIYELLDQVQAITTGMLKPKFQEKSLAKVEVRTTFKVPKLGLIAGSYVTDGTVERGANVRLLRDSKVVFEGKMASLRRFKDDVKEVSAGYECGIGIEGYNDIKDGDEMEIYKVEEIQPKASGTTA